MSIVAYPIKNPKTTIEKLEVFAGKIITDFSDKVVYHDIKYAHRLVKHVKMIGEKEGLSPAEMDMTLMATWFHTTTFGEFAVQINPEKKKFQSSNYEKLIQKYTALFTEENEIAEECKMQVLSILKNINIPVTVTNKIEAVIVDSINYEFTTKKASKHIKLLYQQTLLRNISIGEKTFYEVAIPFLEIRSFYTKYGKKVLYPKYLSFLDQVKKEQKSLSKQEDLLLKKELDINEEELKQLKKNLKSSRGRDDRGIQTLFRTTSKNHYTLSTMIDRKANIMITVNSIIFSLVVGGIIGESRETAQFMEFVPMAVLATSSLVSIVFAVLSIRPEQTHGKFTENEIRNKKGNLLYFGNFHQMHPDDFEWGMLQLLNDGKYLYTSMIKDLYYLGLTLSKKNKLIRASLNTFIIGFVITGCLLMFISFECFLWR
ncbi:MAG: Pycsar system effector family protein [Saprospiraceae bacterium]